MCLHPGKQANLEEEEIKQLCLKSRDVFLSQPILLELAAPIKICGMYFAHAQCKERAKMCMQVNISVQPRDFVHAHILACCDVYWECFQNAYRRCATDRGRRVWCERVVLREFRTARIYLPQACTRRHELILAYAFGSGHSADSQMYLLTHAHAHVCAPRENRRCARAVL